MIYLKHGNFAGKFYSQLLLFNLHPTVSSSMNCLMLVLCLFMTLKSRSVCVVSDLSIEEQLQLYKNCRDVEARVREGKSPVEGSESQTAAYLLFLEDSTRTKESFRNAATSLGMRVNMFDSANSSMNKFETVTDTVKMLAGYTSMPTVFIIRSKVEGLCRALECAMAEYVARSPLPGGLPCFVNAGDGRHEHPTQEFLDEYSFLQQLNHDRSHIHVALIGDLLLGRTIHSKADGLRIFGSVEVDLVAPKELQMPPLYVSRMQDNGFKLRFFSSLDEYLGDPRVAPICYFTRIQLERAAPEIIARETTLRKAVTFRMDMRGRLPAGCRFYHPLPRHGELPEIPFAVDSTDLNAYDRQSINGLFLRTALLSALTRGGSGPSGSLARPPAPTETTTVPGGELSFTEADNCAAWRTSAALRACLGPLVGQSCQIEKSAVRISLPPTLTQSQYISVACIAPEGAAVNGAALPRPQTVAHLERLECRNSACVANRATRQRDVAPWFRAVPGGAYECMYCEKTHLSGVDIFYD